MSKNKTLVLGHLGNIGRRYGAVLNHLGVDWLGFDPKEGLSEIDYEKVGNVIIATPTDTHFDVCMALIYAGKRFLCEKPLDKKIERCKILRDEAKTRKVEGFVVNNYRYIVESFEDLAWYERPYHLTYDYYHSGSDEALWDCCQILYIDHKAKIKRKSPTWRFTINGYGVPYLALENSYICMVDDFLSHNDAHLWTLDDGVKMTEAVWQRKGKE